MSDVLFQIRNITKEFPGVLALDDMSLDIRRGEVLALVGENGAGKSTLIKILTGALPGWTGEIFWEGEPYTVKEPWEAQQKGISTIYQELTSCPDLSVAENIFLGREPCFKTGLIDWGKLNRMAREVLRKIEVEIEPTVKVKNLTVAAQQLIEIARALTMNVKLIIMDEPTSALSGHEVRTLIRIVKELRSRGISVLYISHKMEEIFDLSDRISVIRDGRLVGTMQTKEATIDEVLAMMVGRTVNMRFQTRNRKIGNTVFVVENLTTKGVFENIGFELREGEILGVSGLVGAGRTEMARAIFGIDHPDSGMMTIRGRKRNMPRSPKEALKWGIGFLPEDRKDQGLILLMSIQANITLPSLVNDRKGFVINFGEERRRIREYIQKLSIKTPSMEQLARNLSGGNQQKVVIAKWLASASKILIFDEPTRGIDVGAKAEIYELMNDLVSRGYSIVMISSELPELIGMSDRILVIREGKITGVFAREEATPEKIMSYATGAAGN